jgi:serine/threonine kinase 16
MAVLNAQYKHPASAYSQGLKSLIDSMLKVDPKERPDIYQVSCVNFSQVAQWPIYLCIQVIEMTDRVLQSLA